MILRPNYYYSFLRSDKIRYKKEREENIKYPYMGEILSDSWGDGKEPKDRLLWDEDWNSGDFWKYDDIYPELLQFINTSIKEGYKIDIAETIEDLNIMPNDYTVNDPYETIVKLDDIGFSHFVEADKQLVMKYNYGQYFVHQPNRNLITEKELSRLKGKPYFGDKTWILGDTYMYCFIEQPDGEDINLLMVTLSHRHLNVLESDYEYVRMSSRSPVFKKKDNKC